MAVRTKKTPPADGKQSDLIEERSTLHLPDPEDHAVLAGRNESYIRGWNTVKRRMAAHRRGGMSS